MRALIFIILPVLDGMPANVWSEQYYPWKVICSISPRILKLVPLKGLFLLKGAVNGWHEDESPYDLVR